MKKLTEKIKNCKKCEWLNCLKNKTLSSGWYWNLKSKIIFYWSSVWWKWTERVIPFASGSWKIIDKILQKAWIKKEDIYISNTVKCRLPNLRSPNKEEIKNCKNYIDEEIKIIKPEIIVTMWSISTKTLLNNTEKFSDIVYQEKFYKQVKVIPMFHPAYIMRWIWDKEKYFNKMIEFFKFAAQK